jgi:hypothetical protein
MAETGAGITPRKTPTRKRGAGDKRPARILIVSARVVARLKLGK